MMVFLIFQKQPLEVFNEKGVLKNFEKFTGKHFCWSHFKKETPTQMFPCEFCENFTKISIYKTSLLAASDLFIILFSTKRLLKEN